MQPFRASGEPGSVGVSYDSGLDSGPEIGSGRNAGNLGFSSDEDLEELRPPPVIVDDDEYEQKPQVSHFLCFAITSLSFQFFLSSLH